MTRIHVGTQPRAVTVRPPARAIADERAADAARARYRARAMKAIPADSRIRPLLGLGERVVAVHRSAVVDRREPALDGQSTAGVTGALYVTSERMVLVGRATVAIDLEAVEEAVLSGRRLRLILDEGRGVTIDVAQPRLLRVQIAAARAARRSSGRVSSAAIQPASR